MTNDHDATEQETSEAEQLSVFITSGESAAGLKAIRLVVAADGHAIAIANNRAGAETIRQSGGFPAIIDATRAGEIAGMIKMAKASVARRWSWESVAVELESLYTRLAASRSAARLASAAG